MRSIKCEKCSSNLSFNALNCPRCSYPTHKNQKKCNHCSTILDRARHKYKTYSNYVSNGHTSSSSRTVHIPCTNCGEPEPLSMTVQEFFKSVLNFIVAVVILIVALGLYFKAESAYHEYSNENKSITGTPTIKNNKTIKSTH